MFNKVESFTLTMLGTDTVYTPTLKSKKKTKSLKKGDTVQEYYPKGETLSIVSTLIKTEERPLINHKQLAPYQSSEVAVVNGPKTDGSDVGEKIGIGLGIALNALVRGQTELNDIAHSRGGVESVLIAHELDAIKKAINSCENLEQLIKELTQQQTARKSGKPFNNTPDIIKSLLTQLPKENQDQGRWFNALKTNIANASMNLFIIDPVPGDCWPVTWYDERFFTLPSFVKHAEFVYYENERSDWGFTPIYVEASNPEQTIVRHTLPGHHGTGSAGSNASQQNVVVSPDKTKATHVQKLMIFKLLNFLTSHGVAFKDAREIFHEPTGLGKKYLAFLKEMDISEGIDVADLDFPTIFRKLYDKIYENRSAYEAFNATHYTFMGVAPQRKMLRTSHKYGLLTEVFPKNIGYVNEEHSTLMKEYFFKILQVDSHEDHSLPALIKSAKNVLSKNIRKISNLSASLTEHSIAATAILDSESARQDVLSSFGALIQRVNQQYLTDDWSEEKKQKEKEELFAAVIDIFAEFTELAKIENETIKKFVSDLTDLSLKGIIQTVGQQHANLEEEFTRLQTPTDANLKYFFNALLTQINKDERYSGAEVNPEIIRIFDSEEFARLADYPVSIKIAYICRQLGEQLPKDNSTEESLVEQLTERFKEHHGSSFDEFEKLYHQIGVFINDTAALGRLFVTEEAIFNKHELSLRKKAEALIDIAAQKFYRDRPNALPAPAEKGTFQELVERHAINKYGVVDRLKQEKTVLEHENEELANRIKKLQEQITEKVEQERRTNASLIAEKSKKIKYHAALNDNKEAEYLLLINKKLIPLTEEYLALLKSQLSNRPNELEQDDEIKKEDDKINVKIQKVTGLLRILQNKEHIPHPQMRLRLFYKKMDLAEAELKKHRDGEWDRYCQNALIAAGILLSFIVPGLIALAIYTHVGYSSTKSLLFWKSAGENVISTMNKHRQGLDLATEDVDEEEILIDDLSI
ncbi:MULTISPECIES: hypothetical protein [Legionella]|uniref:Uncharacterized protein n=1 Tax=Legionella resiliens TaxID=2905958 RepID=A0ABS8X821_9GAMM|nr:MULTISPECIES: hypothetical protein [unclassified Legionella]MCE0724865.1 hypothetical protein [Legionella sp. 9fVS26]MCE3534019.1 hypothetical protein [Legionella sp. 8cVS16]QLZ70254.1 hypothetical protein FOLKNPGA_03059 [Legionella sp. PC1000]